MQVSKSAARRSNALRLPGFGAQPQANRYALASASAPAQPAGGAPVEWMACRVAHRPEADKRRYSIVTSVGRPRTQRPKHLRRSAPMRLRRSEPGHLWRRPSLPRSWTFSTRCPGSSGDTVATSSWSRQRLTAIRRKNRRAGRRDVAGATEARNLQELWVAPQERSVMLDSDNYPRMPAIPAPSRPRRPESCPD